MDATDSSTIIQSGGLVTQAKDKSGNNNNLIYPTAGDRPTYSTGTGINGLNCLVYTNNSGARIGTAAHFTPGTGFTAIFVLHGITPTLYPALCNIVSTTSGQEFRIQVVPSVAGYQQLTASIVGASTINIGFNTYYTNFYKTDHYLIVNYNGGAVDSPSSWSFNVNASNQTTTTSTNALTSPFGNNYQGGPQSADGAGFGPGGVQEEFLFYNRSLNSTEIAQLQGYLFTKYALGSAPVSFVPSQLGLRRWYRADSLSGSGSTVAGFVNLGTDGVAANFGGAIGQVLSNAINGQPAVQFTQPDVFAIQDKTPLISNTTPFSVFGVVSGLDWHVSAGGVGSFDFWTVNSGASVDGIHMVALDPAMYPGNSEFIVFVGDNSTPYVGSNGIRTLVNQYFTFVVNYNGGGDFGNVVNYQIYLNGISDTVVQSPVYNDQSANPYNSFQTSGATSTHSAWAEWGIKTGSQITGTDLTNLFSYFTSRYNLG